MRIQFYDKEKLIKTWHNVNPALHFIPNNGDDVLLHFGDYRKNVCTLFATARLAERVWTY